MTCSEPARPLEVYVLALLLIAVACIFIAKYRSRKVKANPEPTECQVEELI